MLNRILIRLETNLIVIHVFSRILLVRFACKSSHIIYQSKEVKWMSIIDIVIYKRSIIVFVWNKLGFFLAVSCLTIKRNALLRWKKIELVQDKGIPLIKYVI